MFDKMKGLMEMKAQAERIKKELDRSNVEVNAVNGITIVINGSQNFQSLKIDETYAGVGNKVMLEKDLLSCMNAAIRQSQNLAAQKMKEVMPGLPGM